MSEINLDETIEKSPLEKRKTVVLVDDSETETRSEGSSSDSQSGDSDSGVLVLLQLGYSMYVKKLAFEHSFLQTPLTSSHRLCVLR